MESRNFLRPIPNSNVGHEIRAPVLPAMVPQGGRPGLRIYFTAFPPSWMDSFVFSFPSL